ncbi:PREDICTED: coiled-coil domain-containing protein 190 [Nanorana parkeri]|uniref:coiled-coil domain-containing protein 190 n=1 Tax=Nanorana parkeri TaxID=125878 RepID=UPI000854E67A|nr:PREDICTED: coiled-coil domain-containing protein 190 [Nanorana parkeri]
MNRSRLLGNNVDKQWEAERRGAKRAEVRLNNGIQEIKEAQSYHINSMTKEQKRLQKDLMRIRQATVRKTTSPTSVKENHKTGSQFKDERTRNQPTSLPEGQVIASGSSMTLQMRINDFMDGVNSRNTKEDSEVVQRNEVEYSVSGTSTTDSMAPDASISSVKESTNSKSNSKQGKSSELPIDSDDKTLPSVVKSLNEDVAMKPPALGPQYMRRRSSLFKDKPLFDEEIYAPDGVLRTQHTMPDFMESLEEAKHARYIRHKVKPDSEKELSVAEIFQRNNNNDK